MLTNTYTDDEILAIIRSDGSEYQIQDAWDALISKYQTELEGYALELWGGDDFLVSNTLDQALVTARIWITAENEIDTFTDDVRQSLRTILHAQFSLDTSNSGFGRSHPKTGDSLEYHELVAI